MGHYLLQKLHHDLVRPSLTYDIKAVTNELARHNIPTQKLVADRQGKIHSRDVRTAWRLLTFIPGVTYTHLTKPTQVRKLGFALGRFHRAFANFHYRFRAPRLLHNTPRIYQYLSSLYRRYQGTWRGQPVIDEMDTVLNLLPTFFLPAHLPQRIVHSDPKVSNFVFTPKGEIVLIDLDTCTRHTALVDLGDAFRSWCATKEHAPHFRTNYFSEGLRGYREATGRFLVKPEIRLIVQAVQLITLELVARYLIDYFENRYFAWDPSRFPSRPAHNQERARRLIALYQDIVKQERALQRIVARIFKTSLL